MLSSSRSVNVALSDRLKIEPVWIYTKKVDTNLYELLQ